MCAAVDSKTEVSVMISWSHSTVQYEAALNKTIAVMGSYSLCMLHRTMMPHQPDLECKN